MQRTKKKRQPMAEKGLYRRHSLEHPLLKEFATYLEKDLQNENYKQEVRILFHYIRVYLKYYILVENNCLAL